MSSQESPTGNDIKESLKNHSTIKKQSYDFITQENVKVALKSKFGNNAILKSWEAKKLGEKSFNFIGMITEVSVAYLENDVKKFTSFIVKAAGNDSQVVLRKNGLADVFKKEADFYTKIIPALNQRMHSIGQPKLKFPECYYISLEKGKELIFLEDLREKGFSPMLKELNQKMKASEILIIVKELARFHAASSLIHNSRKKEEFIEAHECLTMSMDIYCLENFKLIHQSIINVISILDGYTEIKNKLEKLDIGKLIERMDKSEMPFQVIRHADCYYHNIMIK